MLLCTSSLYLYSSYLQLATLLLKYTHVFWEFNQAYLADFTTVSTVTSSTIYYISWFYYKFNLNISPSIILYTATYGTPHISLLSFNMDLSDVFSLHRSILQRLLWFIYQMFTSDLLDSPNFSYCLHQGFDLCTCLNMPGDSPSTVGMLLPLHWTLLHLMLSDWPDTN